MGESNPRSSLTNSSLEKRDLKTPGAVLGPGVESKKTVWSKAHRDVVEPKPWQVSRTADQQDSHRLGPNQGVFQRPQPEFERQDAAEGLGINQMTGQIELDVPEVLYADPGAHAKMTMTRPENRC